MTVVRNLFTRIVIVCPQGPLNHVPQVLYKGYVNLPGPLSSCLDAGRRDNQSKYMDSDKQDKDVLPFLCASFDSQGLFLFRPQCEKKAKWNVAGELFRLSRILYIRHKTFFFLFLKCSSSSVCVPVLVQVSCLESNSPV